MKRQKRVVGDIVCIPLSEGRKAYALILPLADAFFDLVTVGDAIPSMEEIISRPVLFQIGVMRYAVTKGIWKVIGHVEPPPALLEPPKFFIQDDFTGALVITTDGGDRQPATFEECEHLESCAAWDPEHVVSRLEDHFAGRPNKWVELLRPQRIDTSHRP